MSLDPLKGYPLNVGNRSLKIIFSYAAFRLAQKRFGGTPVRELLKRLDVDEVVELAAAGLRHEDQTITDKTVEKWLEQGLVSMPKLTVAVAAAVAEGYTRMYPKGEVQAVAKEATAIEAAAEAAQGESPTTAGPTSGG